MGKIRKLPRVLFFINGPVPSEEEQAAAEAIEDADVVFRNANLVPTEGSVEAFDDVAGEVPELYANAKKLRKKAKIDGPADVAEDAEKTGKPVKPGAKTDTATGAPVTKADGTPNSPTPNPQAGWKPNA